MKIKICDIDYERDTDSCTTYGMFRVYETRLAEIQRGDEGGGVEPRLAGFKIIAYDFSPYDEEQGFPESEVEKVLNKMTSFEIAPPSFETEVTYLKSTGNLEIISIDDPIFKATRVDGEEAVNYTRIYLAHRNLQIIWNALHIVVRFLPILVQFQRRFKERYHSPDGAGFAICQSSFEMLSCDS